MRPADNALETIKGAVEILRFSQFSCRKAIPENPFLREPVIPFGSAGYVVLVEIESSNAVNILAVRHEREEDILGFLIRSSPRGLIYTRRRSADVRAQAA
jgi:hypothetical protein